jgi:hypothetical protein
MLPAKLPSRSATRQRGGAALLLVGFVTLAVGGLSVAMTLETRGAKTDVDRSEAQVRALELAETGIARAQMEIAALQDHDGDGVGNAHGSFAGGTYSVTATQNGDDWTLVSTGRVPKGTRRIEQGVHRALTSGPSYGLLAMGDITVSGSNSQLDAYDSRLGSYASQATNTDAFGPYAMGGGGLGANGNITVSGGIVRGDAVPGVGGTTTVGGVVTGSTAPRSTPLALPDPPLTDFAAALATNDNGNWTVSGGTVAYSAAKGTFAASGGATVVFPGGTYFFSKFTVSGGSTVEFTGPTKIYVTNTFDTSGGSMTNDTGIASNLSIVAHNYDFPGLPSTKSLSSSLSGGTGSILTYYGPSTKLAISGGTSVYGAFAAHDITLSGGTFVHYDVALDGAGTGIARVTQTYWTESKPPLF